MQARLPAVDFGLGIELADSKTLGSSQSMKRGLGLPLPLLPRCDRFPTRTRPPVQKRGRPAQLSDEYQQPLPRGRRPQPA